MTIIMKIFHNVYDDLIKFINIHSAWKKFCLGKTNKVSVFEFRHNLEDNLFHLQEELADLTYRHENYERFLVYDPKCRIIHKAGVKDRIVHTLVSRRLEEIYQDNFICHSYACQKGRGTHAALVALVKMCRCRSRNYTINFWYLKCDIRKFYDNIRHDRLLEILQRKISDEKFIWLIKEILRSFYCGEPGVGLPLGNFTSQWLGNIYLNEFDYFVKHNLRIKNYIRYADDFVILNSEVESLREILQKAKQFLSRKLGLSIHPDKIFLKKFSAGLEWVGYKIFPHYVILKQATRKRMMGKLKQHQYELKAGRTSYFQYGKSLNSYLGQLKHCAGYNLSKKILFN